MASSGESNRNNFSFQPPGRQRHENRHGHPSRERRNRKPLWCPWWALGAPTTVMYLWCRRDLHGLRVLSLLDLDNGAPLMRWSLMYQHPVFRSVESCCVIPVHGNGVTVEDEDGTDIPAEPLAFNSAGQSDPVDQGLPSATSSLKVRAQSYSSYSRFQLHVNGGTSFSNLGTLTGFATGCKLNNLADHLFFLQVATWSSVEHRSTGAARPSVASSLLDLFLMI